MIHCSCYTRHCRIVTCPMVPTQFQSDYHRLFAARNSPSYLNLSVPGTSSTANSYTRLVSPMSRRTSVGDSTAISRRSTLLLGTESNMVYASIDTYPRLSRDYDTTTRTARRPAPLSQAAKSIFVTTCSSCQSRFWITATHRLAMHISPQS